MKLQHKNEDREIDLKDPEWFGTSHEFKQHVYDKIDEGVPNWMFDLKLEILWRKSTGKPLEDYMKELINDE